MYITRIQIMELLTPKNVRNEFWRTNLTLAIECYIEHDINLTLEFYDELEAEVDSMIAQKSELETALDNSTEICMLVAAAVELSTDMNERAAKNYIASLDVIEEDLLPIANICMELYGVLSWEKCKEYADRIIAGESMFTTA